MPFKFNPLTNKLDLVDVTTIPGNVVQQVTTDAGVATPAANNINIFGGAGITVSGAGDTVTITATALATYWNSIAVDTVLLVNNGYICNAPGGALLLTLPAVSNVGDEIEVILNGATSFKVVQGAGQQVSIGNLSSTAGVAGFIQSSQQGDAIKLLCVQANLKWRATNMMGNLTIS